MNAIPTAIMIYPYTSLLAGHMMFSTCPFVRPSVRLFVRLLPTCERYT